MTIRYRYKPDTDNALSWDMLNIGDIYYHQHAKTVNMKTSKNSYVSFNDKRYHTRSKLLQGSHSKVYYQINAEFRFEL